MPKFCPAATNGGDGNVICSGVHVSVNEIRAFPAAFAAQLNGIPVHSIVPGGKGVTQGVRADGGEASPFAGLAMIVVGYAPSRGEALNDLGTLLRSAGGLVVLFYLLGVMERLTGKYIEMQRQGGRS